MRRFPLGLLLLAVLVLPALVLAQSQATTGVIEGVEQRWSGQTDGTTLRDAGTAESAASARAGFACATASAGSAVRAPAASAKIVATTRRSARVTALQKDNIRMIGFFKRFDDLFTD